MIQARVALMAHERAPVVGCIVEFTKSKSESYYDRRSVGESVLVSGTHLKPETNFSPFFFNYYWAVTDLLMLAPSLTRSRICSFQFLLGIASTAFLRSEFHAINEHILLSPFLRLPQPRGPVTVFISPRNRVARS
jgi:hypothetical protein